jgi:hypothetical protein
MGCVVKVSRDFASWIQPLPVGSHTSRSPLAVPGEAPHSGRSSQVPFTETIEERWRVAQARCAKWIRGG